MTPSQSKSRANRGLVVLEAAARSDAPRAAERRLTVLGLPPGRAHGAAATRNAATHCMRSSRGRCLCDWRCARCCGCGYHITSEGMFLDGKSSFSTSMQRQRSCKRSSRPKSNAMPAQHDVGKCQKFQTTAFILGVVFVHLIGSLM